MRRIEERALCLEIACLTGDRTKGEQRAMLNQAHQIDAERNRITTTNPRAAKVSPCPGWWDRWKPPVLPVWDLNSPEARRVAAVDNPDRHPRGCLCNRNNLIPAEGPSLLEAYVAETWEPSE